MIVFRARSAFYYGAGLFFLGLSAAKNNLLGYTTPTPFALSDTEQSLHQAVDIFNGWRESINSAFDFDIAVKGAEVLELGPGAHLGTGALLLAAGARTYCAFDAFPLAANTPLEFYRVLLERHGDGAATAEVLRALRDKDASVIDYVVDPNFDVPRSLAGRKFDLIVSCAAFEHFEDVNGAISALSALAKPGCITAHAIDFQTHTRWIRDKDPNNIYRYSNASYGAIKYPGKPNRKRPNDYISCLTENGWQAPKFVGINAADDLYLANSTPSLQPQYQRPEARMEILSATVVASRPPQ